MEEDLPVAVIGGGPIGTLHAIFLARRGFKVLLFESRGDLRKLEFGGGRSVNLALSYRGIQALKAVGCHEQILALTVPMYGRMIHSLDGKTSPQPYSAKGDAILSVDRLKLNQCLLNLAQAHPNIQLLFQHRLIRANIKDQVLTIKNTEGEKDVKVSFTFGCDGVYSTVRRQLMRWDRLNYQQEYIEHGYKELTMPPNKEGDFAMAPNYLHIWPRGEFMMIALPNPDKTFTMTLYMPYKVFDAIETEEDVLSFFMKHFPDSIDKLGAENLVKDYFKNPMGLFLSVKCYPHYLGSRTLILGDAAHAVVPFFGQGMNAGMEDCLIFDELFESNESKDLHTTSQMYSEKRWKDAHTITDLSMYNYLEMRSHVTRSSFRLRKGFENFLHLWFPHWFEPMYSMVAFSRIPYHRAVEIYQKQTMFFKRTVKLIGFTLLGCSLYCLLYYFNIGIRIVRTS